MRGATRPRRNCRTDNSVSIHAPVRGATDHHLDSDHQYRCFNPRAREGRDALLYIYVGIDFSFNPRAREGRDRVVTPATAAL